MRQLSNVSNLLSIASVALFSVTLTGCGPTSKPRPVSFEREGMKVSVENDGRVLSNFESELVHRIGLKADLLSFHGIQSHREFDGHGKVRGLRVKRETPSNLLTTVGLLPDDVITAVGKRRLLGPEGLKFLPSEMNGGTTVTFERNGVPHQNYYTILP